MQIVDGMSINEAIERYYEKHHALREGNLEKLRKLKARCPKIFDPAVDQKVGEIIEYVKLFQQTNRYRKLSREVMLEKLFVIHGIKY